MSSRPLSILFPADTQNIAQVSPTSFDELEHAAQLLDDLVPRAKSENEKELCREVARIYREAASRRLRRTWSRR
jgi:hypothetical protein